MKKIFILSLIFISGLFLFNFFNPFNIKIFTEEDSYKKEIVVENKKNNPKKDITAKDYFLQGETNLKSNNYKLAVFNFSKAIELNPNYIEAYKERALTKDKLGDFNGSQQDYEQYILLLEHQNQEQYELIKKELTKNLAETNKIIEKRQYDKALVDLSNIINTYSQYPDGYILRGDVFFIMKKYKQALDDYQKALSLGNTTFVLYLKIANTKYELGLYKDSISDYLFILNLNSNFEYTYYKLIGAYIFTDDFDNALKILNKYLKISSTKTINITDYDKWINVLNKYTENEIIRDLKKNLKKLKFV